jgi:hypothetical protein
VRPRQIGAAGSVQGSGCLWDAALAAAAAAAADHRTPSLTAYALSSSEAGSRDSVGAGLLTENVLGRLIANATHSSLVPAQLSPSESQGVTVYPTVRLTAVELPRRTVTVEATGMPSAIIAAATTDHGSAVLSTAGLQDNGIFSTAGTVPAVPPAISCDNGGPAVVPLTPRSISSAADGQGDEELGMEQQYSTAGGQPGIEEQQPGIEEQQPGAQTSCGARVAAESKAPRAAQQRRGGKKGHKRRKAGRR